ncbi:MAG: type II toxin-antitoxin system RelE/ParE family toxin [Rudaea sp.]
MNRRVVKMRPAARRDVAAAVAWFAKEGGATIARRSIDEVHMLFDRLASHPSSGSPRYAALCALADLKTMSLKDFPYLVFYLDRDEWVDVLRVFHGARDIPELLRGEKR